MEGVEDKSSQKDKTHHMQISLIVPMHKDNNNAKLKRCVIVTCTKWNIPYFPTNIPEYLII